MTARPVGTFDLEMKKMVLVLVGIWVPTPCASRLRSLASAWIQVGALGPLRRWQYLSAAPVTLSMTALTAGVQNKASCPEDVEAVATVMFGSASKVPAVFAVRGPSGAFGGAFVDQDFGAWWGGRCLVEIEGAAELSFGG